LREPVRLAREAIEPRPIPDVVAWLRGLFSGIELVPVPAGATLGSEESASTDVFQIGDLLEVRGSLCSDGARQLKVRLLAEVDLTIALREAAGGIESYPLHPGLREAIFELAADRLYHLELLDAGGRPLRIEPKP
jgi:hypothetical protein